MHCAACGTSLPDGARFCPGCGARMEPTAPFGPPDAGPLIHHERRILTVLFADLVGFTAASDGADPEDVHARVRPFLALVREEVARAGGTVARVIGDGVMAVWGYPSAHEDDALRAVTAALGIRARLADAGTDLHARLGVNTGEALVAFGSPIEDADDAMGDAVNVAARLAAAATPDSVLVGETTATLIDAAVEMGPVHPLALKGKIEPVAAREAHRLRALGLPPDLSSHAPLVGRAHELQQLVADVDEASRTLQMRLLVGDAGMGKSRLVAELRRCRPDVRWFVGRCREDAHAVGWALGEAVRAWAGIAGDEEPEVARRRLDAAIPAAVAGRNWLVERLGPLAGLAATTAVSPEERAEAWIEWLSILAADGPTAIVLEDVHWADAALCEFLASPALRALEIPLLILATSRAHDAVRTLEDLRDRTIELAPIDHEAATELAARVLGIGAQDPMAAELGTRGGGNPLFTAELARLVADGGKATALPTSVRAVIGARIDRLAPSSRSVLHTAAVVGTTFSAEAVSATGSWSQEQVGDALAEAVRHGMVRRAGSPATGRLSTFSFRHVLIRETAYGQLTRVDRRKAHIAAARWLSGAAPAGRLDAALLAAEHWNSALGLTPAAGAPLDPATTDEAAEAFLAAARLHAHDAATAALQGSRAIACLARDDARWVEAHLLTATALNDDGRSTAATELLVGALDALPAEADPRERARLVAKIVLLLGGRGEDPAGTGWLERLDQSIADIEPLPISVAHLETQVASGYRAQIGGTAEDAATAFERAIRAAHHLGIEAPADVLARRGTAVVGWGDRSGVADLARALEIAERTGDLRLQAIVSSWLARALLYFGDLAGGRRSAAIAVERSVSIRSTRIEAEIRSSLTEYALLAGDLATCRAQLDHAAGMLIEPGSVADLAFLHLGWILADETADEATSATLLGRLEAAVAARPLWRSLDLAPIRLSLAARARDARGVAEWLSIAWTQDRGELDVDTDLEDVRVVRDLVHGGFLDAARERASHHTNPSPLGVLLTDSLVATIAAGAHRADAPDALAEVAERWGAFGFHWFETLARLDLAHAYARAGDAADARSAAERARSEGAARGAVRHVAEADALLARIGRG